MKKLTLNLANVSAPDVAIKLRQWFEEIEFTRTLTEYTEEEVFLPAAVYSFLVGLQHYAPTHIPDLVLNKMDKDHVGVFREIRCRSDVFYPVTARDNENVPEMSIQWRAW